MILARSQKGNGHGVRGQIAVSKQKEPGMSRLGPKANRCWPQTSVRISRGKDFHAAWTPLNPSLPQCVPEEKFSAPKNNVKKFTQNHSILEGNEKKEFLKGAEIAYETILTSFAKGEHKKLRSLLTSPMVENFEEAIAERDKNNIKSEFTFIGIKESNLEKYEKVKNDLFASVKFVSEVISVKKDEQNKIIEGSPDKIKQVIDYWKFTKNILNKSPNWYLSEIVSKW